MQVFSNDPKFQAREIQVAINHGEGGRVIAIDIIAHRAGWNASIRQGPATFTKEGFKLESLTSEAVLLAFAAFVSRQAGGPVDGPMDLVGCLEEQTEPLPPIVNGALSDDPGLAPEPFSVQKFLAEMPEAAKADFKTKAVEDIKALVDGGVLSLQDLQDIVTTPAEPPAPFEPTPDPPAEDGTQG